MRPLTVISIEMEPQQSIGSEGWRIANCKTYTYKVDLGMLFNVEFSSNELLTKDGVIQKLETMMKLWLQDRS